MTSTRPSRLCRQVPLIFLAAGLATVGACFVGMAEPAASIFNAASRGDLDQVKNLIERDPEVVRQTKGGGLTPLHYAARGGRVNVIDSLVEHGAEVDARDDLGRTPLHHAALQDQPSAVDSLLILKAEVDARDDLDNTPLHLVAEGDQAKVILRLMKRTGKEETDEGVVHSERHGATADAQLEAISHLLAHGARMGARNKLGYTPLHIAAAKNQAEAVEFFIKHGAATEVRSVAGESPLHLAADSPYGAFEAVKELVRLGADPKARINTPASRGDGGASVLARAATWGHLDIVKFLLEQGAPVRYDDGAGQTALQHALTGWRLVPDPDDPQAIADRIAVIDLLAEQADYVNPKTGKFDRGILLGVALKYHAPAAVRSLLKNDPSISADDIDKALNLKGIPLPDNPRDRKEMQRVREQLRAARDAKRQAESDETRGD